MMRIIVEGADGTGKTTLVKHLAERYNSIWRIQKETHIE